MVCCGLLTFQVNLGVIWYPCSIIARFLEHGFWLASLHLWLHFHQKLTMVIILAAWSLTYCFVIFGRLVGISYPSIVIHDSCINMCSTLIHVSEEWVVIINTIISLLIYVTYYDFGSSIIHKRLSFFLQWSCGSLLHLGMIYLSVGESFSLSMIWIVPCLYSPWIGIICGQCCKCWSCYS